MTAALIPSLNAIINHHMKIRNFGQIGVNRAGHLTNRNA